ncbi:MAG: sel1 repeat family protein [Lentisphaeria bacterium]|nr:sel1 repeat family protein [Lentisphaeria bacterium]
MEKSWLRVGKTVALLCSFWVSGDLWSALAAPEKNLPAKKEQKSDPEHEEIRKLFRDKKFDEAELRLLKLLDKGELWVHSMLGNIYCQQGKFSQAYPHCLKAAGAGDIVGSICMGWMKFTGRGCPKDLTAAFRYFKYAADNSDDPFSKYRVGKMLLAGEGCRADVPQGLDYLYSIAGKEDDDNGKVTGYAPAQLLLGLFFSKIEHFDKAYIYLEKAAEQNEVEAWRKLGRLYLYGRGLDKSNYLWSKLCFLAAVKLQPDAQTEWDLGYACLMNEDYEEALHWYRSAAAKGCTEAITALAEKRFLRKIQQGIADKKNNSSAVSGNGALNNSVAGYFAASKKHFGTSAKEVMAQLSGGSVVDEKKPMIKIPVSPEFYIKGWNFSREAVEKKIASRLITDRDGGQRLMYDEFKNQPLMKNLAYPNPTIRWINATYEEAIDEALKKMPFRKCSPAENKKLGILVEPKIQSEEVEHLFWQLRDDLYFHIFLDRSGRWEMRSYSFVVIKDSKCFKLLSLNSPPNADEAAMAVGMMRRDPVSLNNYAVMSENDEIGFFGGDEEEITAILEQLSDGGHFFGAYNLAVFYQNRKKDEQAKKYFALAKKLAGSTMISSQLHRPEIFDRNGGSLVINDLFFRRWKNSRIAVNGGSFAASVIGHTCQFRSEKKKLPIELGMTGIEWLMEKKKIFHPVYLTIDSALQHRLDKLLFDIGKNCNVLYAYGAIVSSKGELIAASQVPYFDLIRRDIFMAPGKETEWRCGFFPGEYLLPVPDQWMKLLGSASADNPDNKVKFAFHKKIGLFPAEGQGVILGINRMAGERDPKKVSGQSATMLRYLLAYIAHVEKKALPELSIYTGSVNKAVKIAGAVKWINFYRPADGIVVNALGEIATTVPGEKLYICVRSVGMERVFGNKVKAELIRAAAASSDAAEKIIRSFDCGK